jgi:hypothetical protein
MILALLLNVTAPMTAWGDGPGAIRSDIGLFIGHPNLDAVAARAVLNKGQLSLENGYLALEMKVAGRLPVGGALINLISGRSYKLRLLDPLVVTNEQSLSGADFTIGSVRVQNEPDRCAAYLELKSATLSIDVTLNLGRGDHILRQQMVIKNQSGHPMRLNEAWPERLGFDAQEITSVSIKSTKLTDVVAYLSGPAGDGLFATLDFPYCLLKQTAGPRLDIGYPPYHTLSPGQNFSAHPVVLGVFTAASAENPDSGPSFAFLRWIERAYPPRIQEPQFHFYHINNDLYDPRAHLYYSYREPEMASYMRNLSATKIMLEMCRELGFNSYQTMEEPFAFIDGKNPDPEEWNEVRRLAEEVGIRLGAGPISNQGILTPMNNPYLRPFSYATGARDTNSPFYPWVIRDASGNLPKQITFCLGSDAFANWFEDELVRLAHLYGFNWYNYDELPILECFDTTHGHPAGGPASLYRQVLNLTRVLENVRRRVPGLLWDTNLGFIPLQPKIVKYVDGIYPNDPEGTAGIITLNRNLNFDEARRKVYTTALTETGIPPVYYRQCQYFLSDNSLMRNLKTFQYEILLDFAMGPNLAVGHLWSELQEMPYGQSLQAAQFLKWWLAWAKRNYALLASTRYLGLGHSGGHAYAHIDRDHGYIFLVNPNYWTTTFSLPLDQRVGLWTGEQYILRELHPEPRNVLTERLPWPRWKDVVSVDVEPLTVRVIEVAPAPEIHTAILLGVQGQVEPTSDGKYRIKMTGAQGRESRFAVVLPPGQRAVSLTHEPPAEVEVNTEKQLKQPPGALVNQQFNGSLVWGMVRFPRVAAPSELRTWAARAASLEDGLLQGLNKSFEGERVSYSGAGSEASLAGFAGAYLENVFQEDREVTLELTVEATGTASVANDDAAIAKSGAVATKGSIPSDGSVWYSTQVKLPFVQVADLAPAPDRHLYLVLLLHHSEEVAPPRVWINGQEAPVRFFRYARVKAGAYYVDGTEAGLHSDDNTIVVFLRHQK